MVFATPDLALIGMYAAVPRGTVAMLDSLGSGWRRRAERLRSCSECSVRNSYLGCSRERRTADRRLAKGTLGGALLTAIAVEVALPQVYRHMQETYFPALARLSMPRTGGGCRG